MAPDRHPGCPGAPPANVRGAFNAHSPGDGGTGLVQPVFRSPARIPAAETTRRGLCAAPPSEKRYTLSLARLGDRARKDPTGVSPYKNRRWSDPAGLARVVQ